ncbi:protein spaetzle 4 [Diachasmimorpha longicaudata]|uniref:protein spaetzle 4 n=1 Tax=Diachasmimorpha longicaudata TaxID=58733 RepID=UPI0030B86EDE
MKCINLTVVVVLNILPAVLGQFNSGGPNTFNYDASSACSKPYSRRGREHYEKLPCDFRRQNWCTIAGSNYPWHAVRRFVYENQGLMRRMYGDEKHINVLKNELKKNDIELEYEDNYHRYFDDFQRSMHDDQYEFEGYEKENIHEYQARAFASESPKQRPYPRFSFHPSETTITSSTTSQTSPSPTEFHFPGSESMVTETTSTTVESLTKSSIDVTETKEKIIGKTSTISGVTLSEIAHVKNASFNEIPGALKADKENISTSTTTEWPSEVEGVHVETTIEQNGTTRLPTVSSIDPINQLSGEENKMQSSVDENQQQFRPRPEYHLPEAQLDGTNVEGQLFQDFVVKDQQEQPVLKLRGVNACPVKDEVVAPFWANNTKGEILALLNLYPFEQFLHWEKCTDENKQMYCREGCKCEQQYRLYRLLAYDPNNECRGIFSDWFKFPSCCVCRCYDLPIEFRVTSRSPRARKQTLKIRSPSRQ